MLAVSPLSQPPIILQVSDLHTCQHQQLRANRERLADLQLFTSALVPNIAPQAMMFTGDLTDAKTADGMQQQQYEWEWQAYRNVTASMLAAAGPRCQVCRPALSWRSKVKLLQLGFGLSAHARCLARLTRLPLLPAACQWQAGTHSNTSTAALPQQHLRR